MQLLLFLFPSFVSILFNFSYFFMILFSRILPLFKSFFIDNMTKLHNTPHTTTLELIFFYIFNILRRFYECFSYTSLFFNFNRVTVSKIVSHYNHFFLSFSNETYWCYIFPWLRNIMILMLNNRFRWRITIFFKTPLPFGSSRAA